MEIVCGSCNAKLNIPDEKLPQGQRVSVRCPRCKNKMVIDATTMEPKVAAPPDQVFSTPESSIADTGLPSGEKDDDDVALEEMSGFDDAGSQGAIDSYEDGEKLALVMVGNTHPLQKIKEVLDDLGYHTIRAENTQKALSRIRFQNFDLVILSDLFDNTRLQQSPVLQYLNHLSMSVRRRMFVLLISDTFRTMDPMSAFAMSANMVANWKDLGRLSNLLGRAVLDDANFYKVFMDTLKETGKA
jgi:predicted Zn finger-like uncharacterized protein